MSLETVSASKCFGGTQYVYAHEARTTRCRMQFSAYVPPQAADGPVPVLTYLSGLTCTEENFTVKAAVQRHAAEHGLLVVAPDTSPRGEAVPDASRPDEEWYLPGRNLLLLSTAATYGAIHGIAHLAIGILASNPFPDARPEFFRSLEQSTGLALDAPIHILTPLAGMHKADVIRAGADLPVQHALSCADPVDGGHCGVCGKCGERRRGFIDAGVDDPTCYARLGPL